MRENLNSTDLVYEILNLSKYYQEDRYILYELRITSEVNHTFTVKDNQNALGINSVPLKYELIDQNLIHVLNNASYL